MDLDELDELEDDEEERILEQYRRQRMAQIKDLQAKSKYGDVREISAEDYVAEVWDYFGLYFHILSVTVGFQIPDQSSIN